MPFREHKLPISQSFSEGRRENREEWRNETLKTGLEQLSKVSLRGLPTAQIYIRENGGKVEK